MLSLREVRHAASALELRLSGSRLQRVVQPDEFRLVMEFYGYGESHFVLFSCRPSFARVSLVDAMPKAPQTPPTFVQYARAHFLNGLFQGITTAPGDRRLGIRLSTQAGSFELILSILGARSNIYLVDGAGILLYAFRPLAETRRTLVVGQPWTDPEGSPKSDGEDRWEHVPEANYLQEIGIFYSALENAAELQELGGRIESALRKEEEHLGRKAINLQQDLGEAVQAEDFRRKGELLKTALHRIQPGSEEIAVKDFDRGAEVIIPLDPKLSPAENLAAYFKRYQKELRSSRIVGEQLDRVRARQREIGGYLQKLQAAVGHPDPNALESLAEAAPVRKLLARYAPEKKPGTTRVPLRPGGKEMPAKLRPKRYRTDRGLEIWVGRSDEGNDYLTTRLARGNDLFFHLEGYPGSHVILRTEGKADPPAESILEACELAVHFSKLKEVRQADVHVAPVKNVRKPKGVKRGLVYVSGGKTVHLRRDPKRLENVLASRIDE